MNGLQEMCYLPTWPAGFPEFGQMPLPPRDPGRPHPKRLATFAFRTMVMETLAEEAWNIITPEPEEWMRPQPKCVGRFGPYD